MSIAIFLFIVIGIGAVCGAHSRDVGVGIGVGVMAFIIGATGWGIYDDTTTSTARHNACSAACLAVDAPMARSDGGCWCYRGASEMFRVEVPK